jgi:glycosyltransferase involved in cell wall biosynthesis
MTEPRLSVIIPALNEAIGLPLLLGDLRRLEGQGLEILVVDGGSTDETIARAEAGGATVLRTTPGRARQLSTGATAARGDWLLFLHADSRLGPVALERLAAALDRPRPFAVAVFRFAIDLPGGWKGFIERGQAIREALFGLPYGEGAGSPRIIPGGGRLSRPAYHVGCRAGQTAPPSPSHSPAPGTPADVGPEIPGAGSPAYLAGAHRPDLPL